MSNPIINVLVHKVWYDENDKYHREDGPAYESSDVNVWYIHGKRHREDGPAYESSDVNVWYIHGKRHRVDGPAVEWINGDKCWCYRGDEINCNSQQEFERLIKLKAFW